MMPAQAQQHSGPCGVQRPCQVQRPSATRPAAALLPRAALRCTQHQLECGYKRQRQVNNFANQPIFSFLVKLQHQLHKHQ
jgi:hypothetical protein